MGDEQAHVLLPDGHLASGLARLVDHLIDIQARAIVGRHDQRAVRLLEILARDRGQPFIAVRDCMDAPLRPSLAEVRAGSRPTNVYWG